MRRYSHQNCVWRLHKGGQNAELARHNPGINPITTGNNRLSSCEAEKIAENCFKKPPGTVTC
jgi:hypothetical protein